MTKKKSLLNTFIKSALDLAFVDVHHFEYYALLVLSRRLIKK